MIVKLFGLVSFKKSNYRFIHLYACLSPFSIVKSGTITLFASLQNSAGDKKHPGTGNVFFLAFNFLKLYSIKTQVEFWGQFSETKVLLLNREIDK
jgi:hypothetical protein